MGDRCTGHCCEKFMMPMTPAELQALASEALSAVFSGVRDESRYQDLIQISLMVIPLGMESRFPEGGCSDKPVATYTCKHYDPNTKNCGIYEIRPKMCQDYPYRRHCYYGGCTWDAERWSGKKVDLRTSRGTWWYPLHEKLKLAEDFAPLPVGDPKALG